ncbi:MAG: bifunctional glutamate N-acetyltransferase/amino-acid acetyltransferase ArgJ, partial [Acidimicrobiia bacterium]|nr:bifunctional glutamate N-acetyltransferase/amino-acid acetyltransferase ArgJ [Acidimicrobiia bacterium]
ATADHRRVPVAATFTTNRAPAAPVVASRAHLAATGGRAAAVVLNSGNANAATGASGSADAERACALVATELGCAANEVLVCSTGLIGIPLPKGRLVAGIPALVAALDPDGGAAAAQAILTTDTGPKETLITGPGFSVGGMAKGAAMLAPAMAGPPSATMLAVLTTDAAGEPAQLQAALDAGVAASFDVISTDGACSTNDTVLLFASGVAGPVDGTALAAAVAVACAELAEQMVVDAEGATKVVRVQVTGAATADDARRAARRVAESQLCKCSWYGEDPYWGRIVSELGASGAAFDPDRVAVAYGGIVVCAGGVAAAHDAAAVATVMAGGRIVVAADLGLGSAAAEVLTCDLTPGYIDENMRTS